MKIVSLDTARAAIVFANKLIEENPCVENLDIAKDIANTICDLLSTSNSTIIFGEDVLNDAIILMQRARIKLLEKRILLKREEVLLTELNRIRRNNTL